VVLGQVLALAAAHLSAALAKTSDEFARHPKGLSGAFFEFLLSFFVAFRDLGCPTCFTESNRPTASSEVLKLKSVGKFSGFLQPGGL